MLGSFHRTIGPRSCPRSEVVGGSPAARLAVMDRAARAGAAHPDVREAAARCAGGSVLERAARVASLVQSLPYLDDATGTDDLVRAPCETLRVGGDCDCRATLAAALLELVRVPWRLAWIEQPGAPLDHVLVQVYSSTLRAWLWVDVTVPGARVGEHPRDAVARVGYGSRVTGG